MINQLLNDHSISKDRVYSLLNSLSETGAEYSDLYFQHSIAESWLLDEGIVKDGSYNISHGVASRQINWVGGATRCDTKIITRFKI